MNLLVTKKNIICFFIYFIFISSINQAHPNEEKKTLSCRLEGGLGNQLFQIAATLASAWDNGYEPVFPELLESPSIFAPRPVYWSTVFAKIPTCSPKIFSSLKYQPYQEINEARYNPILLKESHAKLLGYWQSEKYFLRYKESIQSLFQPTESLLESTHTKFSELTNSHTGPIISVHLRRGDYMQIEGCLCLWENAYKHYYIKAVSYFPQDSLFVVFSDDPAYAREFFEKNFPLEKAVFPHDIDYIELYMMAQCDYHILANSTFSWWGAYLNLKPHKIVIGPKEWSVKGSQGIYRPDYYPPDWITISVL